MRLCSCVNKAVFLAQTQREEPIPSSDKTLLLSAHQFLQILSQQKSCLHLQICEQSQHQGRLCSRCTRELLHSLGEKLRAMLFQRPWRLNSAQSPFCCTTFTHYPALLTNQPAKGYFHLQSNCWGWDEPFPCLSQIPKRSLYPLQTMDFFCWVRFCFVGVRFSLLN